MQPWLVAWLIVTLTTTVAFVVVAAFLVRQVVLLWRTAGRLQQEVGPIADEIAAASARAADAATRLSTRSSPNGSARRKTRR